MVIKKINKKGMTLNTVLGLIIGLACVVILMFLAVGMYNLFIQPGIIEQAKATLKGLVAEINGLKEGEEGKYIILNPESWSLISDEETIYLCDISEIGLGEGERARAIESCKSQGVLEKTTSLIIIPHDCLFKTIDNCFLLDELPKELFLKKEKGVVTISTKEQSIGQSSFDDILELKGKSSKTVRDLFFEYADTEKKSIEKEIEQILIDYFNRVDVEKMTKIKKEDFMWRLDLYVESSGLIGSVNISIFKVSSDPGMLVYSGNAFSSSEYYFKRNNKNYIVVMNYYDKKKVDVGGGINI